MSYDPKVPPALLETQSWFASIITRPVENESRINPISPSGNPISNEASRFIMASPTLQPWERIEIYNQQYWWRLIKILQEAFPFVTRLFGFGDFNQKIAVPFLTKYPPDHWSLNQLGEKLPQWIEEEYKEKDRDLIKDAALIDWAYTKSFCAIESPPLLLGDLENGQNEEIAEKKLYLQPHIHLFEFPADILTLRSAFLKEDVEFWEENDFPEMDDSRKFAYILYRSTRNEIQWEELSAAEYHMLYLFKEGCSIEKACAWLEERADTLYEEAVQKMHIWFQKWAARQWLTQRPMDLAEKH